MNRRSKFFEDLSLKQRVYSALMLRYIVTRYGRENLGFIWLVLEPMILCLGVMLLWSYMKGASQHGLQVAAVVYTGYMPLTLWRHMSNAPAFLLRFSKNFLNFRMISALDILLSRLSLEFISVSASAIIVYVVLSQFAVLPPVYDWSLVLAGWMLMGVLGLSWGLIVGTAVEISSIVEKFLQPAQYLLLPISGCFFMLDWMPESAREYLSYVPLVHAYEMIRSGFFEPSVNTYSAPYYALGWSLVGIASGLLLLNFVKDRIEA